MVAQFETSAVYYGSAVGTVIQQIKRQAPHLKQVNVSLLNQIAPESVEVEILRLKSDGELTATEAELDEC
jgi:hypothetical protein